MTVDVKFEGFKAVKPNALTWSRAVENFSDTATIKLPAKARITKGIEGSFITTGTQFKEGQKVIIAAGYDGKNDTQFRGFVRRVNFTIPVEIECEGYAYQLRKKLGITKNYKNTTVKSILTDLISGTDIKLHPAIPNIPIDRVEFKNASGIQVLEWFKEKCLLAVYFVFDQLYVGGQQLALGATAKFRLNWNVIKDNELKFNQVEFADVKITVLNRNAMGVLNGQSAASNNGQVSGEKKIRTLISDPTTMKEIADRERKNLINRGYEGSISAFLKPFAAPGMAAQIIDKKYAQRNGKYFITGVEGSFSPSGGRQKIKIGNSLG